MTNEEAIKEAITKLKQQQAEYNDTYVDFAGVNDAYNLAIRSLEAWDKVKAAITETILYYKDWGLVELKAQYKEEALKEVLECINRHLKEGNEK